MDATLASASALADPDARQAAYEAALASAVQAGDLGALTSFCDHGESGAEGDGGGGARRNGIGRAQGKEKLAGPGIAPPPAPCARAQGRSQARP